jgi:hypothetical protein
MRLVINSLETKRYSIKAGAQFANGNVQLSVAAHSSFYHKMK